MNIKISTQVESDVKQVWDNFDIQLLKKLAPPFPFMKVLRYDGNKKGDTVSFELNFVLFKQIWTSHITESLVTDGNAYFIDEGAKLPFFLKEWHHKHVIENNGANGAKIIDLIHYKTPFLWLDYVMFPLMYGQFAYRIPIYRRFFNK
ncbi:MAG: SRPBCC family protein [Spirosomataceae bacterium]